MVFSRIDKKTKLDFHFKSKVVLDNVALIIWMNSAPLKMMSTIHKITGDGLEVLRMRKYPERKSTNAQGANTTFKLDEYEKELPIPTIVNDYNNYKIGVDTHNQCRTYHDI
jgi:hypothetical protein